MGAQISIVAAEVVEVIYNDKNPNLIYGIKVKLFDGTVIDDETSPGAITAMPLNSNVLRIPLKGEVVLLVKAPSSYTTGLRKTTEYYYLDIVNLQGAIHHNSIPTATKFSTGGSSGAAGGYNQAAAGNTNQEQEPAADKNFSESETIKPLQPYVGDVIVQGRYGNSIRMSSSPKLSFLASNIGDFVKPPKWKDGNPSAPITIIRNTEQTKDTRKINDFVTEDFKDEDSVIVMTSGQQIEFEQASGVLAAIKSKKITSWKDDKWGKSPQTLISSGRIIFNSWQKEIIAFAKSGIGLSSETTIALDANEAISLNSKKIELGDEATEPLILGNLWKTWTQNLITALGTVTAISPNGPCVPLAGSPQWASIKSLEAQITQLLSEVAFTKKIVNVVKGKSYTKKPSDRRLKENLKLLGQSPNGINIYEFNFIKDPGKRYQGVIADELIGSPFQKAVSADENGFLIVDYSQIDVKFIPSFTLISSEIKMYSEQAELAKERMKDGNLSKSERLAANEAFLLYSERIKSGVDTSVNIFLEAPMENKDLASMALTNKNYIPYNTAQIAPLPNQSIINGVNAGEVAMKDLGLIENIQRGTTNRISEMLRYVNFRPGMYWSAAAVSTWWIESGVLNFGFGTSSEWLEWAIENNRLSTTPVIGSIALFGYNGYTSANHCALVIGIDNDENVTVIEGDSMARYQESGQGGVFVKIVNPASIIGYVIP
jgi:hypothetical protein